MDLNETILANGIIPVSPVAVSGIPGTLSHYEYRHHVANKNHVDIALSIPDFEGQAVLTIYSNTTNTTIGCYSATITNGNSFSQNNAVAPVLGIFTIFAFIASFAAAAHYDDLKTTRQHYAHSISVLVIFEVFQSIYLTGAFDVNWPSVLPAWWSNFAWAAGIISLQSMQNSISKFVGADAGSNYLTLSLIHI